ncbi:CBS domain-containing protein [Cohnella terricola]|uniref:CBS domain-containing protein n=1 Tax=Cohnella terricola TaxID=1289167 RepID=A0A559JLC7_9BACL|nr:CBS domain-containing protein [Cohnella terricola]TVY00674.1 CBS domain-containing protein [Cohnella terricola]
MRKIADIMSSDCITVSRKDNIQQTARLMRDNDIGFIPVVEGRNLIGVVTDRDLVIRGYANDRQGTASIEDVFTEGVRTVSPDMSVDEAANIMASEQIRRLPVVQNGILEGIVSLGDMAVREIFVNEAGEALSDISENGIQGSSYAH